MVLIRFCVLLKWKRFACLSIVKRYKIQPTPGRSLLCLTVQMCFKRKYDQLSCILYKSCFEAENRMTINSPFQSYNYVHNSRLTSRCQEAEEEELVLAISQLHGSLVINFSLQHRHKIRVKKCNHSRLAPPLPTGALPSG